MEGCIDDVPDELLMHTFKYLSAKDLCLCERCFAHDVVNHGMITLSVHWTCCNPMTYSVIVQSLQCTDCVVFPESVILGSSHTGVCKRSVLFSVRTEILVISMASVRTENSVQLHVILRPGRKIAYVCDNFSSVPTENKCNRRLFSVREI